MLNWKMMGCCCIGILFLYGVFYREEMVQWGYNYNGDPVVFEVPKHAVPLLNASFAINESGKQAWADSQYDIALHDFHQALQLRSKAVGTNHPFCASIMNNIAGVYTDQHNYTMAEGYYKKAVEIVLSQSQPDDHDRKMVVQNLLQLYYAEGKTKEALALKKRAGLQ